MAKAYSFVDMTKPASITGTPVAGGTLASNTTYYYRVIGTRESSGSTASYWVGKTKASDEFTATTTDVNKSVQISFTQPAGQGLLSYRIFRWTTTGGMLNNATACIAFFPLDVTYRSGTTITFTDTGYANSGGNTFLNIDTDPHGVLSLSGSLTGDRFSIVDLYNADVTNGWGVVQKIDSQTYLVNCYVVANSQFWADSYKNIIFADGISCTSADMKFGLVSGANQTYGSCNITITTQWLSGFTPNILNAYRTNFLYVYPPVLVSAGLGLASLSWNSGMVLDCSCERFRGFTPNSLTLCTLKNFTMSGYDNCFNQGQATFLNVRMLAGSRVWQIGTQTVEGRGVFIDGGYACLCTGGAGTLNLIDSQFVNGLMVNTSSTGFVLNDKLSFNMLVTDPVGSALSGANVKIYDNTMTKVVDVNTSGTGVIAEQFLTRRQLGVIGLIPQAPVNKYPFTIVVSKAGYIPYTSIVSYTLSSPVSSITSLSLVKITINNLVAGSTVQIYDVTTATELYKGVVAGTSQSIDYSGATTDTIRIRIRKTGYTPYEYSGVIGDSGIVMSVSQSLDTIYTANGIDGSTVTEFSLTEGVVGVFINCPSNVTTGQTLYNWYNYAISTATFIDDQANLITAQTAWSYVLDDTLKLKNTTANTLYINGANINNVSSTGAVVDNTGGSININGYFPFNSANDVGTAVVNNSQTLTVGKFIALK